MIDSPMTAQGPVVVKICLFWAQEPLTLDELIFYSHPSNCRTARADTDIKEHRMQATSKKCECEMYILDTHHRDAQLHKKRKLGECISFSFLIDLHSPLSQSSSFLLLSCVFNKNVCR